MRVSAPPPALTLYPKQSFPANPPAPPDILMHGNQTSGQLPVAKMLSTGVVGIGLAVPCTYAGMAGGALVGGAFGGALGPLGGALLNHGLTSILSTAWHVAGSTSHLGLLIGGACGLLGSFAVSNRLGKLLSWEESHPKPINPKNPVTFVAGTTLLTAGLSAGAVGGLTLAGGAAAAGTIASDICAHGLHLAALSGVGSNALICGTAGAVVAGIVGVVGSFVLTRALARNVFDPLASNLPTLAHKASEKYQQNAANRAAQKIANEEKDTLERSQQQLQKAHQRRDNALMAVPLAEKELADAKAQLPTSQEAATRAEARYTQINANVSSLLNQRACERENYDVAVKKLGEAYWPAEEPARVRLRQTANGAEASYVRLTTNYKDSLRELETARTQHSTCQANLQAAQARLTRADSALLFAQLDIPKAEAELQRFQDANKKH